MNWKLLEIKAKADYLAFLDKLYPGEKQAEKKLLRAELMEFLKKIDALFDESPSCQVQKEKQG
jgi:hypothetical protein